MSWNGVASWLTDRFEAFRSTLLALGNSVRIRSSVATASDKPTATSPDGAQSAATTSSASAQTQASMVPEFAEGRIHVAPSAGSVWAIALVTLLASWVFYAGLLHYLQHNLKVAYAHTPLLRLVLEESPGKAFVPTDTSGRQVAELSSKELRSNKPEKPVFYDDQPVSSQALFLSLKALEVVDTDTNYEDVFPKDNIPTRVSLRPAKLLVEKMRDAAGEHNLRSIAALSYIAGIATKIGSEGDGGTAKSRECYAAAFSQILAGYPERWQEFVRVSRASLLGVKLPCPVDVSGKVDDQPQLTDYMLTFRVVRPSEVPMARLLLTLSNAIPVGAVADDASNNLCDGDFRSEGKRDIQARAACLAEILIRRLISRATASPDVKRVQFWIDILIGWPQALLNWVALFLLSLLFVRWLMFAKLQREMRAIPIWLNRQKPDLMQSDKTQLEHAAKALATDLDAWLASGHTFSKAADGTGSSVRKDSLAVFMASKALKRLLVGENQPELFREFCITRRALVDESAWLLRYLARSLPALGFIGTILGILFALESADGILRAQDIEGRVVAMASVTGQLAFAFSHTFLALVASLVTGFLIDRQTAHERILLFEYEEALVDRIDRAERA